MTFDTLSYARKLKQAGLPEVQAQAIADATRDFVLIDVATKADIAALKTDIGGVRAEMAALEQRPLAAMETQSLRLTIRLGGLIAVAVAVLAPIIKL